MERKSNLSATISSATHRCEQASENNESFSLVLGVIVNYKTLKRRRRPPQCTRNFINHNAFSPRVGKRATTSGRCDSVKHRPRFSFLQRIKP